MSTSDAAKRQRVREQSNAVDAELQAHARSSIQLYVQLANKMRHQANKERYGRAEDKRRSKKWSTWTWRDYFRQHHTLWLTKAVLSTATQKHAAYMLRFLKARRKQRFLEPRQEWRLPYFL